MGKGWKTALPLVVIVVVGCPQPEPLVEEVEHPPQEVHPPAEVVPELAAPEPAAPPEQHIMVANQAGEPMIVEATVDGRTFELGTVLPRVTGNFFLTAEPGTEILLHARDSAGVHRVRGSVRAEEPPPVWVIPPN